MSDYNWTNKELLQIYFTLEEPYPKACRICRQTVDNPKALENHVLVQHRQSLTEKVRKYVEYPRLRGYFKFDEDASEIICTIDGCIISLFHGQDFLLDHLINHHLPVYPTVHRTIWQKANNQGLGWIFENLVWRYFTPYSYITNTAQCNICGFVYENEIIQNLENHLKSEHPEKIKVMLGKIQEEIREDAILFGHFKFDMEELGIRCIDNECNDPVNYFLGINNLREHLNEHMQRYFDSFCVSFELSAEEMEQLLRSHSGENITSINVDAQQPGPSRQVTGNQGELPWYPHSLVWEHFIPAGKPWAICIHCKIRYYGGATGVPNFERHLRRLHSEVVQKIVRDMKPIIEFNIYASYLKVTDDLLWIICKYCNREVNFFHGINALIKHVELHVAKTCPYQSLFE